MHDGTPAEVLVVEMHDTLVLTGRQVQHLLLILHLTASKTLNLERITVESLDFYFVCFMRRTIDEFKIPMK